MDDRLLTMRDNYTDDQLKTMDELAIAMNTGFMQVSRAIARVGTEAMATAMGLSYLTESRAMFMVRWQREGVELKALIKRLEEHAS